ncbi:MAG TPA: ABC transporter permease [Chloroflexi bacterium]|nr:ABC transporter permease [Chloroflexota bacterium]
MGDNISKSLKRIGALVRKESTQVIRDRRTLVLTLVTPIMMLFLFAYAVTLTVDHLPMAVADMSMDTRSQAFIDALTVSGFFDVAMHVQNETEVIQAIDEGKVRVGVVIPPDFAAQVERGEAQALIIIDGSDSFTVQSGYSAAIAIAQSQSIELLMEKAGRLGAAGLGTLPVESLPIETATRVLYNPNMDGMVFAVPAIAAMLLQFVAINLTAMSVVREYEWGTIEQLLITPIRPIELMIAKIVPNIVVTVVDTALIVLTGIYWFGVPFRGDPWLFIWLSLLFVVSGLGLGLLISTITRSQNEAQQIAFVLLLLAVLLTGFIYPMEPMPAGVRFVGNLIPLTYFNRIVRGVFTKGIGLTFLWQDVVVLAIYGFVVIVGAAMMFRKRLD